MKAFLIALLVASTLSITFDIPVVKKSAKQVAVESSESMSDSIQSIVKALGEGDWMSAIPAGLKMARNLKFLDMPKTSKMPSFLNTITRREKCPWKRCVRRRLRIAHASFKKYLCALARGKDRLVGKLVKCIAANLWLATKCRRRSN